MSPGSSSPALPSGPPTVGDSAATDRLRDSPVLVHWEHYLVAKPLAIVGIVVLGLVLRWVAFRTINKVEHQAAEGSVPGVLARSRVHQRLVEANPVAVERRAARTSAIASLLRSATTGVLAVIVMFMVVSQLGYDIAPLIASAGIVGVALGFGAQSLVSDFLSGIFMILEDQYGVGDGIQVGMAGAVSAGTVEAVGLRVTRIRDVDGTVWYVRNGQITRIGNGSQNWARTVLDVPVAYSEDLERIRGVLSDVGHDLYEDPDFRPAILEEPSVWGVERWDPDGIVIRMVLRTAPHEQANVAREMRERIKKRFDVLGVVIPLPQRVVWLQPPSDAAGSTGDSSVTASSQPPRTRPDPSARPVDQDAAGSATGQTGQQ